MRKKRIMIVRKYIAVSAMVSLCAPFFCQATLADGGSFMQPGPVRPLDHHSH